MLDPCHPLPGLAGCVLKVRWRWKLQRVCRTTSLCSELSSCHLRCTPAVEEKDAIYSNVLYRRRSLNFQYPDRVKPLEILTSLWVHPVEPMALHLASGCNNTVPMKRCKYFIGKKKHLYCPLQIWSVIFVTGLCSIKYFSINLERSIKCKIGIEFSLISVNPFAVVLFESTRGLYTDFQKALEKPH